MFENIAPQQGAESGVTGQGQEAPLADEATPATEQGEGNSQSQGEANVDEALSPANIRIQKLANENRKYRQQLQRFEQDQRDLEGARNLDRLLRSDPQKARLVMDLLNGRSGQNAGSEKDPFEGYLPHEAEALRTAMELKQWKQQMEQQQQLQYQQSIEENNANLESVFEAKLQADGFIDKEGNFDEGAVKLIAGAVLTQALASAKDPARVTEKELLAAYNSVMKGTQYLEKRALKSTVRTTPPPSASQRATMPVGRTKETEEQRIASMVREFKAGA